MNKLSPHPNRSAELTAEALSPLKRGEGSSREASSTLLKSEIMSSSLY